MKNFLDSVETAIDVCEILQNAGHEAVFAGGCVRDMLLGIEPKDIDIATSAKPEEVEALFKKTVAVGKSFGVIRVIFDEEEFEVATFRKDSGESDGRRPDSVEFSSMKEDAKRRDLTINAMFLDPIGDKIFDFVGGQDDLKTRRIAFVGVPDERIAEDKLRLLRVIRFAARGGWHIAPDTERAVRNHANEIGVVSKERIADELTKILTHKNAHAGFRMLKDFGFWSWTVPRVSELAKCNQDPIYHPEGDVFRHTELMLKNAGEKLVGNVVLAWAIVLHDIAKPDTYGISDKGRITAHGHAEMGAEIAQAILEGLRFDRKTIDSIVWIVENHMKLFGFKDMKQSNRMKIIANENFDNLNELHRLDCVSSNGNLESFEFIQHVKQSTPATQIRPERLVDGNDLIALGLKPGVFFKKILESIADEQREGRITNKHQGILFAQAMIEQDDRDKADEAAQK